MRAGEGHGLDIGPVKAEIRADQENARFGKARRLLNTGRRQAAAGRDIQAPGAGVGFSQTVAEVEAVQRPFLGSTTGAFFGVRRKHLDEHATGGEIVVQAVEFAQIGTAQRAVVAAVENQQREGRGLAGGELQALAGNLRYIKRWHWLTTWDLNAKYGMKSASVMRIWTLTIP